MWALKGDQCKNINFIESTGTQNRTLRANSKPKLMLVLCYLQGNVTQAGKFRFRKTCAIFILPSCMSAQCTGVSTKGSWLQTNVYHVAYLPCFHKTKYSCWQQKKAVIVRGEKILKKINPSNHWGKVTESGSLRQQRTSGLSPRVRGPSESAKRTCLSEIRLWSNRYHFSDSVYKV